MKCTIDVKNIRCWLLVAGGCKIFEILFSISIFFHDLALSCVTSWCGVTVLLRLLRKYSCEISVQLRNTHVAQAHFIEHTHSLRFILRHKFEETNLLSAIQRRLCRELFLLRRLQLFNTSVFS